MSFQPPALDVVTSDPAHADLVALCEAVEGKVPHKTDDAAWNRIAAAFGENVPVGTTIPDFITLRAFQLEP